MSYYNSKNKSFRTWLHFIELKTKLLRAIRPGHSRSRCLGPYEFLIAITAIIAWETGSKFDPLSPSPQPHTLKGASHQRKKRANNMFGLSCQCAFSVRCQPENLEPHYFECHVPFT